MDVLVTTAFGSPVRIEVYDKKLTDEIKEEIKNYLIDLEEEFSVNLQNSFVYKFNSNQSYDVTTRGKDVLNLAKEYYLFSEGKFNPTVYSLSKLWHFAKDTEVDKKDFTPPTKQEIQAVLDKDLLDFDKVWVLGSIVFKENEDIKIDLGGILKGCAIDFIEQLLSKNGYERGYISIGTSSMGLLSVEKLSLRHPEKGTDILLEINCSSFNDVAVSTSGDYEKYYDYEGKRYSHIIDPKTGTPYSTGIISTTIICGNEQNYDRGAFTDAMTTALCLCSFDKENPQESELVKFMKKILVQDSTSSIYAVYSLDNEKLLITNKEQGKDFTLLDDKYSVVNI